MESKNRMDETNRSNILHKRMHEVGNTKTKKQKFYFCDIIYFSILAMKEKNVRISTNIFRLLLMSL